MEVRDLRYCKVCLVTDVKMFSMNMPSIRQAYSQLVQIYIAEAYQMYVCYECVCLLHKYQDFRSKCIRALHVLSSINMDHTKIPKEVVRIIDRKFYNLESKLECTSILQCNSNDQYVLANNENCFNDNFNSDVNIRPEIDSELNIRPDINSDLDNRPDTYSDLDVRPNVNSDLDTNPGINSNLDVRPDNHSDLDIKPDINFDLDVKPDTHFDLDIKQDINFDIDVKPDINFDLDIKLNTPKLEFENEVSSKIIPEPKCYVPNNSDASYNMPETKKEYENTTKSNTEINQQNASDLNNETPEKTKLNTCSQEQNTSFSNAIIFESNVQVLEDNTCVPEAKKKRTPVAKKSTTTVLHYGTTKSITNINQEQNACESFSNEIIFASNDQVSEDIVCVPEAKKKRIHVAKKSTTTVLHHGTTESITDINQKQNACEFDGEQLANRLNCKSEENFKNYTLEVKEPVSEESILQKYKLKDMTVLLLTTEDIKKELILRKESSNYKNNPYKCFICYKGFGLKATFDNHMKKHNPENGSWECEHCQQRCRTNYVLKKHKLVCHTYKFCCMICPYVCASSYQARLHTSLHEGKKYTCNECGLIFSMPSTLATHKHMKHSNETVCELCGSMFATDKGLYLHKKLSHKQDNTGTTGPKCEECDVQFATETAFKRHLVLSSKHTVSNGCEICGETFNSTNDLNNHLKTHPQKVRFNNYRLKLPASCNICGTWLTDHNEYQSHMKSQHPSTRKRRIKDSCVCDECATVCKNQRRLQAHQFKHGCKRTFECLECRKTFKSPKVLRKHENVHTRKHVFQCDVCQKEYLFKNALVKHIKAHFGIRPYPCTVCDKTFIHQYEVRMHTEYVHQKKPWPKRDRTKKLDTEDSSVL